MQSLKNLLAVPLLLFSSHFVNAQNQAYFSKNGIAINGYDPVAYFIQANATPGKEELSYTWMGNRWLFSSHTNLDSFMLNPERYAPQYGGYCAYGLSENYKASTNPLAWTIVEGKLYLNYSPRVKNTWVKESPARIIAGDNNWPALKYKSFN